MLNIRNLLLITMKQFLPLLLFILSILCILCVGFYPQLCVLLYVAFIGQFIALFMQSYGILKIKKQAIIKAYYKQDSLLYRYFGRFLFVKVTTFFIALIGSVPLFFMLVFPSGGDILIFCLLVPLSIYSLRVINFICKANISADFAPTIAKKYTAIFCALLACIGEMFIHSYGDSISHTLDIQSHYQSLLHNYGVSEMTCQWWQEFFGFVLLKKAVLDVLYQSVADTYLHIGLNLLFICGHFASFASFALLCIGSISCKESAPLGQENLLSVKQFFAMLFFLIFLYIAFNISIHLQPLAKSNKDLPTLLSTQLLSHNNQYIELSIQGAHTFIHTKDLLSLHQRFEENVNDFQQSLNFTTQESINEYLAQKERIIDEYSKWYFSVRGEYTRLFYAAIGKGEDIAQEQFLFLLKSYTPYDLQEHLNGIYDTHIENLKLRLEQSFSFFTTHKKPSNATISFALSFKDINAQISSLSPRATDGVAALLGASVIGAMILKTSGKALAKSTAKAVSKSVAKKSLSGAVGAGGSIVCGVFAPLCAIGFFVASDYAINSVDEMINEDEFKRQMREGFDLWELQLKNSLISYNSQLSKQILEKLSLQGDSHIESAPIENKE